MHLHCNVYARIIMLHQRCIKDVQLDGIKMPQKCLQRRKTPSSIYIDIQILNTFAMHLHCNVYAKKRKGKYIYILYIHYRSYIVVWCENFVFFILSRIIVAFLSEGKRCEINALALRLYY